MYDNEGNKNESPYHFNCTNLTIEQFHDMNIIRGTTALICMAVLVVMLVALCMSKAYTSFVQRLVLYLVATTILVEICQASNLENLFQFSHQEMLCTVLGFMTNWVDNIASIQSLSIIIWTIILAVMHLKCTHYSSIGLATRWKVIIDFSYILIVILLPLLLISMPLKHGNYGIAVAWCWIRAFNESCEDVGFIDQMVAGYGLYGAVGVIGIIAMTGVTIAYCRLSANFSRVKAILLQSLALTSFVLLSFLVVCTCLAIRIRSAILTWRQHYTVWLFYGAAIPLFHLIIPIGFFGSFYLRHFRNKFCKKHYRPGVRMDEDKNGTAPISERQNARSSTYFSVPYTNGFTNVRNDSETTPLHPENTRRKPHVSFV